MSAVTETTISDAGSRDEPLLTVVIPTHDVQPWVDELLASVLACELPLMEVVVVDDHSSDGTVERLSEFAAIDPRVHIVRAHLRGGAGARNIGLRVARGRYVVFADGDDIVPPGSYERLVESLERSGSDIAFGDWLKFSSVRTWQPSKNWRVFDEERRGVPIADVPALIRGRAVWNKVFRRSFLERIDLTFPEVPRSNDIFPMTQAYLAASAIDVLPDCVYLYRDRPGTGSMTARAGADAAAISYFTQEAACAALVAGHGDEGLAKTYSSLVFDADAWLHLSRFLRAVPAERVRASGALQAVERLVDAAPHGSLPVATPHKQILWVLLAAGEVDLAVRFNDLEERSRLRDDYDAATLEVWVDAIGAIAGSPDALPEVRRSALVVDGLATLLVHHARDVDRAVVDELTERFACAGLADGIELSTVKRGPVRQVVQALQRGTSGAVWLTSTSIKTRLVVDHVELHRDGAVLSGPVVPIDEEARLTLIIRQQGGSGSLRVEPVADGDRWSATISSSRIALGRWDVVGGFAIGSATVEVPVVTARMQLPVAQRHETLRVLGDRARSWRVVLERRRAAASRAVLRVARRVTPSR